MRQGPLGFATWGEYAKDAKRFHNTQRRWRVITGISFTLLMIGVCMLNYGWMEDPWRTMFLGISIGGAVLIVTLCLWPIRGRSEFIQHLDAIIKQEDSR